MKTLEVSIWSMLTKYPFFYARPINIRLTKKNIRTDTFSLSILNDGCCSMHNCRKINNQKKVLNFYSPLKCIRHKKYCNITIIPFRINGNFISNVNCTAIIIAYNYYTVRVFWRLVCRPAGAAHEPRISACTRWHFNWIKLRGMFLKNAGVAVRPQDSTPDEYYYSGALID